MGTALVVNTQSKGYHRSYAHHDGDHAPANVSLMDKTIEKIIGFTYLGSYSEYSVELADYQVLALPFFALSSG